MQHPTLCCHNKEVRGNGSQLVPWGGHCPDRPPGKEYSFFNSWMNVSFTICWVHLMFFGLYRCPGYCIVFLDSCRQKYQSTLCWNPDLIPLWPVFPPACHFIHQPCPLLVSPFFLPPPHVTCRLVRDCWNFCTVNLCSNSSMPIHPPLSSPTLTFHPPPYCVNCCVLHNGLLVHSFRVRFTLSAAPHDNQVKHKNLPIAARIMWEVTEPSSVCCTVLVMTVDNFSVLVFYQEKPLIHEIDMIQVVVWVFLNHKAASAVMATMYIMPAADLTLLSVLYLVEAGLEAWGWLLVS